MTDNPYLNITFGRNTGEWRRPKQRVVQGQPKAPMVLRDAEKARAESDALLRRYKKAKREERDRLLAGPHGQKVRELVNVLKSLQPGSQDLLFKVLDRFAWYRELTDTERHVVLSMISHAIIRMREREGLSPIDDSLPGEEPTVFEVCRKRLVR